MTRYTMRITRDFTDAKTLQPRLHGQYIEVEDEQRARLISSLGLGHISKIEHEPKEGPRILFISTRLYKIGGLETADRAISEQFKSKNIAFLTLNTDAACTEQLLYLGRYHDVYADNGDGRYECDVAIFQHYDSALAIDRIKARKYYQQCHNDLSTLKKVATFQNIKYANADKMDKFLAVSETAKAGLKKELGIDSVVMPNLMPEPRKLLKFVVLSRASREKGIDRVIELAKRIEKYTSDFVIFLAANLEQSENAAQIKASGHIVPVEPSVYAEALLEGADYLIQLSRSESFCYSVREALARKVPVIVSDLPELRKVVVEGENGYILADDMPEEQIQKIINEIPKPKKAYARTVAPIWHRALKGEL